MFGGGDGPRPVQAGRTNEGRSAVDGPIVDGGMALSSAASGRHGRRRSRLIGIVGLASVAMVGVVAIGPSIVSASIPSFTSVAPPNAKAVGVAVPNGLSPELKESVVVQGSTPLENPSGTFGYYGYLANGPMIPLPGTVTEASKTEPDKNTYLVLKGQHGPDKAYDYGTHFLFQGHETGAGYITRVNLDADPAHKVTLLATQDASGKPLPVFDGSVWNPFTQRLLFSAELGASGGIWEATPDFPSTVVDMAGIFGRGGYEGIQVDSVGQIWIVEDTGGKAGSGTLATAKQPNSFVYRFVPKDRHDLSKGGRRQVLQIEGLDHKPIVFGGTTQAAIDADILSQAMKDLHTYGNTFKTNWVTIHDTSVDGTTAFDANALAKAKLGTPLKRPENGQFRPDTGFREFFFDETGDTNANSPANAGYGGWGGILHLVQDDLRADHGWLNLFYAGDQAHTGLDNTAFLSRNQLVFVEDAGDGLHTQRNALDSAYVFDVRIHGPQTPVRLLAEGRDASATIDSALAGTAGFQNEGDNEITGFHVSNGDPTTHGLIGNWVPRLFRDGGDLPWRVFWTQQHGDNVTWEITAN